MIHVIATIILQPETRHAFLQEFGRIVPDVRGEDGCLEYGAAIDVASGLAAQPAVRPDVAVVVEKWRDLDSLRAHLVAPHMVSYRDRVRGMVISTTLQVLTPA